MTVDESTHNNCGALVLRSLECPADRQGRPLVDSAEILLGAKFSACVFLHACGHTDVHRPFATYEFHYSDGGISRIPLVPHAVPPRDAQDAGAWALESNIQDWWPAYPQFTNEHSKHFVVTPTGDPFDYERYLYTLLWINSRPDVTLTKLRIVSDPQQRATLALLAVTAIGAEAGS